MKDKASGGDRKALLLACEQQAGGAALSKHYGDLRACFLKPIDEGFFGDEDPGDDPYLRAEGDGTCTFVCFDAFVIAGE